ncbi:MAG: hypothetical protein R2874_15170 [Desulfobacterales bacterium]
MSHLFLESAGLGIADASERQTRKAKDDMLLAGILGPADFHRFLVQWHRMLLFLHPDGYFAAIRPDGIKTEK